MGIVNQNSNNYKIWYPYEVLYIEGMLSITRNAMADQQIFKELISESLNGNSDSDHLIIDLAQSILRNGALISKYLWPIKKLPYTQRGEKLREALNIQEPNPLQNKNVRNSLEHFDEKLDDYLAKPIAGNIVPSYVGKRPTENIYHFFTAYFIDEMIFSVLGEEILIDPVINELIRINALLEQYIVDGRLPADKKII